MIPSRKGGLSCTVCVFPGSGLLTGISAFVQHPLWPGHVNQSSTCCINITRDAPQRAFRYLLSCPAFSPCPASFRFLRLQTTPFRYTLLFIDTLSINNFPFPSFQNTITMAAQQPAQKGPIDNDEVQEWIGRGTRACLGASAPSTCALQRGVFPVSRLGRRTTG